MSRIPSKLSLTSLTGYNKALTSNSSSSVYPVNFTLPYHLKLTNQWLLRNPTSDTKSHHDVFISLLSFCTIFFIKQYWQKGIWFSAITPRILLMVWSTIKEDHADIIYMWEGPLAVPLNRKGRNTNFIPGSIDWVAMETHVSYTSLAMIFTE